MNNTVENDFLDFPRYSGYIRQVRWTMYKTFMSNFLRISHAKNHKNRLIFDRVIQKIKGKRSRCIFTIQCYNDS